MVAEVRMADKKQALDKFAEETPQGNIFGRVFYKELPRLVHRL